MLRQIGQRRSSDATGSWKTGMTYPRGADACPAAKVTVPDSGCSIPLAIRRSVDLPDPEGPAMPTISPAWTVRLASRSARIVLVPLR